MIAGADRGKPFKVTSQDSPVVVARFVAACIPGKEGNSGKEGRKGSGAGTRNKEKKGIADTMQET